MRATMKKHIQLWFTAGILSSGMSAAADVLELKNGTVLNGKYAGGTPDTMRFETAAGTQVIETSQAIALTFTAPPPSSPSAPASPAPAAVQAVMLPAGTTLLVR